MYKIGKIISLGQICFGPNMFWVQYVLGTICFGTNMFWSNMFPNMFWAQYVFVQYVLGWHVANRVHIFYKLRLFFLRIFLPTVWSLESKNCLIIIRHHIYIFQPRGHQRSSLISTQSFTSTYSRFFLSIRF